MGGRGREQAHYSEGASPAALLGRPRESRPRFEGRDGGCPE